MQEFDVPKLEPRVYEIADESSDGKLKSILLLEDDTVFAETLRDAMEIFGYSVAVVPTGAEGVQQILAKDFDAIVCDMVMPNFPGDMFYKAVERTRPHLCERFIFITGHQGDHKVVEFIKGTGRIGLWKPFEMRQLFGAIESVTSSK